MAKKTRGQAVIRPGTVEPVGPRWCLKCGEGFEGARARWICDKCRKENANVYTSKNYQGGR